MADRLWGGADGVFGGFLAGGVAGILATVVGTWLHAQGIDPGLAWLGGWGAGIVSGPLLGGAIAALKVSVTRRSAHREDLAKLTADMTARREIIHRLETFTTLTAYRARLDDLSYAQSLDGKSEQIRAAIAVFEASLSAELTELFAMAATTDEFAARQLAAAVHKGSQPSVGTDGRSLTGGGADRHGGDLTEVAGMSLLPL